MTCCKKEVQSFKTKDEYQLRCDSCGKQGRGRTQQEAELSFKDSPRKMLSSISNLPMYVKDNARDLLEITAPFVANNSTAFKMLLKKNIMYVENLPIKTFGSVFNCPEGRESLVKALEDAIIMGAELGKMGYIVPYGTTAEFLPTVEAFLFALTTGSNAPFTNIEIESVHKNDNYTCKSTSEGFVFDFTSIILPRGDCIGVVIIATKKDGQKVGRLYDKEELLKTAKAHSPTYKQYLQDIEEFEIAKTEGRLKSDGIGEYIERIIPKKDGSTWTKKIYKDSSDCPYVTDEVEMLKKTAGKNFLKPYMRVRNSVAAVNELSQNQDNTLILDDIIDSCMVNLDQDDNTSGEQAQKEQPNDKPSSDLMAEVIF